MVFICPICKNTDKKYIGYKNNIPYCRRCISFCGEPASERSYILGEESKGVIKYPLSNDQIRIANEILENFKSKKNTLVYAVCGAGKTELVFKVIEFALQNNMQVGFAIPRKDVVIELANRLKNTFKNNKVIGLYGGNTNDLNGDIIVLTTHQLYRYEKYFDLLIMDEIDAFPYKDNSVLIEMFKRSIKGNYVFMSATPSKTIIKEFSNEKSSIVKLFTRYHLNPIPIPKIQKEWGFDMKLYLIKQLKLYKKEQKPCLIFVPTIYETETIFKFINYFVKDGECVHSKKKNRGQIIDDFRKKKYSFLVTTAILERGVTLKNLQVIIYHSDDEIYNSSSLIQISGRVGRIKDAPKGDVIFLCSKETNDMKEAINTLEEANKHLKNEAI